MSEYRDRDDPERSASYRSAMHDARQQGIKLTAVRDADGWTVTASHASLPNGELSHSGPTPADAAWHVLAELQDGQA